MSRVNLIRQRLREGVPVSEVARQVGVSRDTVRKYGAKADFSPEMPTRSARPSKLDPYKATIDMWLDEDEREWRKQRHTARRIWRRLVEELGADVSESTVSRYVRAERDRRGRRRDQFLDLTWEPGEAQADFGEADVYLRGVRTRMSFFVMAFPHSNVGFAQLLPGESAECVCEGLRRVFEHVGGVPSRVVLDNASGAGRRVGAAVRTSELFGACAAHYGFAYSFCSPNSGHEKGSVENKVGAVRASLLVPVPRVDDLEAFNARLLARCEALSDKPHWRKGERELDLFLEDRAALSGLPEAPFRAVRWARPRADKKGMVRLDGPHLYSTDPSLAGRELVAGLGAFEVEVYTADGSFVCSHPRAYGSAPTDTSDPSSQLALLCRRAGAWRNSRVRAAMSEGLREHMDSLPAADLRAELRLLRDESVRSGWAATLAAAEGAFAATSRLDEASVSVAAARALAGGVEYEEPVDLGAYDRALPGRGR